MIDRLCAECGCSLFVTEGAICFPCWRSDVTDFLDLLQLGSIGGLRQVSIHL